MLKTIAMLLAIGYRSLRRTMAVLASPRSLAVETLLVERRLGSRDMTGDPGVVAHTVRAGGCRQ